MLYNRLEGPNTSGPVICNVVSTTQKLSEPEMPPARGKALFAYFLLPIRQKAGRLAGRDPPMLLSKVSLLQHLKNKLNSTITLALSPAHDVPTFQAAASTAQANT
jgi:hypothetical protein